MMLKRAIALWIGAAIFGLTIGLPVIWAFSQFHPPAVIHQAKEESFGSKLLNDPPAFFTAVLAIITGGLAFYTARLWTSTSSLVSRTEEIARRQERAFVHIDSIVFEIVTVDENSAFSRERIPEIYRDNHHLYMTRFAVRPIWRNSGKSPTRNMTVWVRHGKSARHIPHDYANGPTVEGRMFIAPQAAESSDVVAMLEARSLIDWTFEERDGAPPLVLIWGRADYEDVFGEKHFVEWCYRVRLLAPDKKMLRAEFIQYGDFNRTDEDRDQG